MDNGVVGDLNLNNFLKKEVIWIIDYVLEDYSKGNLNNSFTLPNGDEWTYQSIIDYIKENLK